VESVALLKGPQGCRKANRGPLILEQMTTRPGEISQAGAKRGKGRPFPKGVSGNPHGRRPIPADIKQALLELVPDAIEVLRKMVKADKVNALSGKAAENVLDRVYGKPAQGIEHSGPGGGVLRIEVVYTNKVNGKDK
jgi:hypothetical protein